MEFIITYVCLAYTYLLDPTCVLGAKLSTSDSDLSGPGFLLQWARTLSLSWYGWGPLLFTLQKCVYVFALKLGFLWNVSSMFLPFLDKMSHMG